LSFLRRSKVPLNRDTVTKCKCMQCPVQIASTCAVGKNQKLMQENKLTPKGLSAGTASSSANDMEPMGGAMAMQQNPPSDKQAAIPNSQELPAVYCSNGRASCSDIGMNKNCVCPSCQVYKDYSLSNAKPVEHYCFNDKAQWRAYSRNFLFLFFSE
jgi:hypothetical protein